MFRSGLGRDMRVSNTAPYRSSYEFENLSPSTHLTFTCELEWLEPRMRPFAKLIRMALQPTFRLSLKRSRPSTSAF